MEDYTFIIIALLIALINWLAGKFKKKQTDSDFEDMEQRFAEDAEAQAQAQAQAQVEAQQRAEAAKRQRLEAQRRQQSQQQQPSTPPPLPPKQKSDPIRSLREAFEAVQAAAHPEPPPQRREPRRPSPPPIRSKPKSPGLTHDEKLALERFRQREAAHQHGAARARTDHFGSVRALLEDPKGIRNAIVVREILGPPKALQDL